MKTRAKPVRKVFGRRLAQVTGNMIWFELRNDGLHVRGYRRRKERVLSFADLVSASNGQGLLALE